MSRPKQIDRIEALERQVANLEKVAAGLPELVEQLKGLVEKLKDQQLIEKYES